MAKPRKVTRKATSAAKQQEVKRERTWKDWVVISIYILLALALVVPLVTSLFGHY